MNDNYSDNSNEFINNIDNSEYDSYIEKKYINNIFKVLYQAQRFFVLI